MRFRRAGTALSFDGRCIPAVPNLGSHAGVATTVAGPCPFTKTQRLNFQEERSNNNQIVGDLFEGYGTFPNAAIPPRKQLLLCGEPILTSMSGDRYKKDKFTLDYAGKIQGHPYPEGIEIPTVMLTEAMASENIIRQLADPDQRSLTLKVLGIFSYGRPR